MSQITKPIALDETLQDVVTAIQGITQGGMIVSTGNVGSSTQPVYINGGVPTAGKSINDVFKANAVTGSKNIMQNPLRSTTINGITLTVNADKSITLNGTATARTDFVNDQVLKKGSYIFSTEYSGTGSTTGPWIMYAGAYDKGNPSQFDIQFHFTGESASFERSFSIESDVNMRSRFACVQAGTTLNNVTVKNMIRPAEDSDSTYHKPVMTNEDIVEEMRKITTGTPTNPATGLSLQDHQFEKSGNVVVFRVTYKCTSNVTLTEGFAVCTLPWTPAYVTRITRIVGDTNDSHTQNMSYGTLKTDKKLYGGPNDAQSTTGNYIEYYGTYLTND